MAKISGFEKGKGKISRKITEVECIYNIDDVNGEKYIAFSTYGSENRKFGGKASQVLHLNKACANEFVQILTKEFGL